MKAEKVIVTWENIQQVTRTVVKAAQEEWGIHLLKLSDGALEIVYNWMDSYIHENYLFSGDPSKADLDDFITIEIKNGD